MRADLLGMELDEALRILEGEGIRPVVQRTAAPGRESEREGTARVVYAADSGERLIAAVFARPLAESPGGEG